MSKRKIIGFIVMLILGLAMLYWVIAGFDSTEVWQEVSLVKTWQLALFFTVSIINFTFCSLRWGIILLKLGHAVRISALWIHQMAGYALSYITPVARAGGEPIRIFFLKEIEKVRLRDATSSVLIDKYIELMVLVLFGVFGLSAAVILDFAPAEFRLFLSVLAILLLIFVLFFFYRLIVGKGIFAPMARLLPLQKFQRLHNIERKIAKIEDDIIIFFQGDRKTLIYALLISLLSCSIMVFEYWLVAGFFNIKLTITQAFIMMAVSGLAFVMPIPGGVGAFEGIQALIAPWFGYNPASFIAIALIIRLRDAVFTLIGLGHILRYGAKSIWHELGKEQVEILEDPLFVTSANLSEFKEITHGFFGREGGVSDKEFSSLNVRFGIGDSDANVRENREHIRTTLGLDSLVSADQHHSDNILIVDKSARGELPLADALICAEKEIGIMVQTADCQPILIYDPENKVVGAIHAGWKGATKNILGKTIKLMQEKFGTNPNKLVGAVGPCISHCKYEFQNGKEVLSKEFHGFLDAKNYLDLGAITERQWITSGGLIDNLVNLNICTATHTDSYFSHRAENGQTGRFASVIGLR